MVREKFNLMQVLNKKREELKGKKKLSLVGQGDYSGADNVMRGAMNIKHHNQHLCIDNPEVSFVYEGKENVEGENSSFYTKTDKPYTVYKIVKKYNELMKGKVYFALYFLYCKEDNSYKVVERREVENLTENFGFQYNNEYLDQSEEGDHIPENTMLTASTSYDEFGNVSVGVNGRILYAVHPAVQDDAIIVSKSFAKRMVANNVISIAIPVNADSILLNLYGKDGEYRGLPNIGDIINDGIIAATRPRKERRLFSDLRDSSLTKTNEETDQIYYCNGASYEVVDINVYNNKPNAKQNKSNKQIFQYYNDERWFYTEVYRTCKSIIKSGSTKIDPEINRWMRLAMNYCDTSSLWEYNGNIFSDMMIEILVRKKEELKVGRKITGKAGNKTVVCSIWNDEDMPYLTTESYTDEYGVVHAKGVRERVDLITNPLAIINRTIPMILYEGSISFILDRVRKHMATMDDIEEQSEFMFDILDILNHRHATQLREIYDGLNPKEKKRFINESISLDAEGRIITSEGIYNRWEAFSDDINLRDSIIKIYEKYGDVIQPYNIFVPKPKWGRDIYIGKDCVGYQYVMMLKQSGEKGFSVRSSGTISDESLPEKSNSNKTSRSWKSTKPIRFGEYELPNFLIITDPCDFALVSALYRSSIDGRRFMYEAILSEDGNYSIPDSFTSRSAEILQVYLKSLGVRMETINDEDEYIGEPEHMVETVEYRIGNHTIMCTVDERYHLKKLHKTYKKFMKKHPNEIDDMWEVWEYIVTNLPFDKSELTENIINLFKDNIEAFSVA